MAKLAEVRTLYDTNCRSIPDMLRQAAGTIESETEDDNRTKSMVAVQIHEDGHVQIYGWGETDDIHAIGALHLGIAKVMQNMGAIE